MTRSLLACALAVFASACSAGRSSTAPATGSPDPRYLYQLLDARKLGAQELAAVEQKVPAVASWVATSGHPDFIIQPGPSDVQLVYYRRSLLVHFHRGADGQWNSTQLSPLPSGLNNILPSDIRAGTGQPISLDEGCWTTSISGSSCKTCCMPPQSAIVQNCNIQCTPAK